ncbi:MAG: hypothetical protein RLZZ292_2311 [Bacteroidota bacterium]|jgi:predicted transcriptional regulator
MQKLTNSEEEIMHYLWQLERGTVSQLIELMPDPKPPHSTVSSFIRILEKKEFVSHKAYGKTHEYFPTVSKAQYSSRSVMDLVRDYFDGSVNSLVSFLVKDEKVKTTELEALLEKMKKDDNKSIK